MLPNRHQLGRLFSASCCSLRPLPLFAASKFTLLPATAATSYFLLCYTGRSCPRPPSLAGRPHAKPAPPWWIVSRLIEHSLVYGHFFGPLHNRGPTNQYRWPADGFSFFGSISSPQDQGIIAKGEGMGDSNRHHRGGEHTPEGPLVFSVPTSLQEYVSRSVFQVVLAVVRVCLACTSRVCFAVQLCPPHSPISCVKGSTLQVFQNLQNGGLVSFTNTRQPFDW